MSYHGYHKVEICAIKKQLWPSWDLRGDMSKSNQNSYKEEAAKFKVKMLSYLHQTFLLSGYKWPAPVQHQNYLDSSLSVRTCRNTQTNSSTYIGRVQPINKYRSRSARRYTQTFNHKTQRPLSPNPLPKT